MKIEPKDPARTFQVGTVVIKDCGTVALEPDEQVTFVTASGSEYDVARKDWGYYATPSTNGRLARIGLRACLVINGFGKLYVNLVEPGREQAFFDYLSKDAARVLAWLDTDEAVASIATRLEASCAE